MVAWGWIWGQEIGYKGTGGNLGGDRTVLGLDDSGGYTKV